MSEKINITNLLSEKEHIMHGVRNYINRIRTVVNCAEMGENLTDIDSKILIANAKEACDYLESIISQYVNKEYKD